MRKFLTLVLLGILCSGFFPERCCADSSSDLTADINYNTVSRKLLTVENLLKKDKLTPDQISDAVQYIGDTRAALILAKKKIEQELEFVSKRIEALGDEPEDGKAELPIIAQKRKEFNKELVYQRGKVAEADILLARLDEIEVLILNTRSQELLGNLLLRQEPLIYPSVFFENTKLFIRFIYDIVKSPLDWYRNLNTAEKADVRTNFIPVGLLVSVALWLGVLIRLWIMRHFGYCRGTEHLQYGRKVTAAVAVAVAYGVIPALIIGGFLLWMIGTKLMTTGFFGIVINSVLFYALLIILFQAVARVVLAPHNSAWRLVNIGDDKAKRIALAFYYGIFLIGISELILHIAGTAGYAESLVVYLMTLAGGIKAFCILWITKRILWDGIKATDIENVSEEGRCDGEEDAKADFAFRVMFFISVLVLGALTAALSGYPYLSAYILNNFILTGIIVGGFIILRKSISETLHHMFLMPFWTRTFKMRRRVVSKIDFWSGLVIDPVLIVAALFCILSVWGVSTDILRQTLYKILFGFKIGGINISLIAVVTGIIVFFTGLGIVRALKRRLMNNVLSKMEIDDGTKHSLASGFGFLGIIISALLAVAVMGVSLTNLALIAGALSLGIGLGLQNIVNNFVSGIILLFERPIKVGDWVVVNGQEGIVKQINIRATEIETWKKASVIIPNADILSNTVTNLTHDDKWGRIDITVSVSYGSDCDRVKEILLSIAETHKRVLKKPSPYVLLASFGDSGLNFELRCYTSDIMNGLGVASDLRSEIYKKFAAENIEIPFPQRVMHMVEETTVAKHQRKQKQKKI